MFSASLEAFSLVISLEIGSLQPRTPMGEVLPWQCALERHTPSQPLKDLSS